MFNRIRAGMLHEKAVKLQEAGRLAEAEEAFRESLRLDPAASGWFDLGLLLKYQSRWSESLECNRQALALNPEDEGARWNMGIAATALGAWAIARDAWRSLGINLPGGDGPIKMKLGLVPIRLDPEGRGEVVWCDRIDPARAVVANIPLPETGLAFGDLLLHDGAPTGYRLLNGKEVPVFDALEVLEQSRFSTFVAEVAAAAPEAVAQLEALCDSRQIEMEDWAATVRLLCKACSEGRPHSEQECAVRQGGWRARRRIGFAAVDEAEVGSLLQAWSAQTRSQVISLERAVPR